MPAPTRRRFLQGSLTTPAAFGLFAAGSPAADPPAKAGASHALLVGCTRYPNLAPRYQLRGPANDVVLVRQLLTERFGFPEKNVVTLSEAAGGENRPTRAAIEREFRRLAGVVKPGDQVFVQLSGHGSQQPDQDPPQDDDPEPDGLDETFLPADVGKWDDTAKTVANAIIDDELRAWAKAITSRGAALVVVMDSCHSGTGLRDGEEPAREVAVEELVPAAAIEAARKRAEDKFGVRRSVPPAEPPYRLGTEGAIVALYACQSSEPTVECPMPRRDPDAKYYGLLTYALCKVLTEARTPLTYRELARRVHDQYAVWRRTAPTPLIEGSDAALDREFLGRREWPGRSRFTLKPDGDDGWTVTGGEVHGLTGRSVLAVYPPPGSPDADKLVGHARVWKGHALEAGVVPCAYNNVPAPKTLPAGGRCEPVYADLGDVPLRVAAGGMSAEERTRLRAELARLTDTAGPLVRRVDDPREADWLLGTAGGKLFIEPARGGAARILLDAEEGRTAPAAARLSAVARAQNLLRVAAANTATLTRPDAVLGIGVKLFKVSPPGAAGAPERVDPRGPGLVLHEDDRIQVEVTNTNKFDADITLLFVDSRYGIHALFPRPGAADNRLPPGKAYRTPALRVNAKTTGVEHLVAIAVEGTGVPVDFSVLTQPTLAEAKETRTRGGSGGDALGTPLGKLFGTVLYGDGADGGVSARTAETCELRLLTWQVAPKP